MAERKPNLTSRHFIVPLMGEPVERDVSIDNAKIKPDGKRLIEIRHAIEDRRQDMELQGELA